MNRTHAIRRSLASASPARHGAFVRWLAGGMVLASASCASGPRTAAVPPHAGSVPSAQFAAAASLEHEGVVRAGRPAPRPALRAQSDSAIQPVSYEAPPEAAVQQAGLHHRRFAAPADCRPIEFSQECRVPLMQQGGVCPPAVRGACPPGVCCPAPDYMPSPEELADEYICDGGDRGNPLFYSSAVRDGIDAEDTFATYVSGNGESKLEISNRVCLYAPRFAAVRSIANPSGQDQYDKVAGVTEDLRVAGYDTHLRIDERTQRDMPLGIRVRDRAGAVNLWVAEGIFVKDISAENHVRLIGAFEDLAFLQEGLIGRVEAATIARLALAAGEWATDQTPVIVAEDIGGQEVKATFKPEEYIGVDTRYEDVLRICKLADKREALPGDVVTFTLRIDNLGKDVLRNVVVTDSLTPRLELLPDSLQSDLPGEFSVQPNKEGSSMIHFKLKDDLKGRTGGVITFQCKVR